MDNSIPADERAKSKEETNSQSMPGSEEIIDLLALAPNLLQFKPSEKARNRVWELVAQEKAETLTPEEKSELDYYALVEHMMRLVKARARHLQKPA